MSGITFDVDSFFRGLDFANEAVRKGAERGMNDTVDDLIRVSSVIAPHDKGILEKAHTRKVEWVGDKIEGEVVYSVREGDRKDGFNYALWTHEMDYELGEKSARKPGTAGMSGTHYGVGNKYLERPLKGESETYKAHIASEIRKEMGD